MSHGTVRVQAPLSDLQGQNSQGSYLHGWQVWLLALEGVWAVQGEQGARAIILNHGPIFSSRARLREKKGSWISDVFLFGWQSK